MTAYRALREDLGSAARFSITSPNVTGSQIDIGWSCGCSARGPSLELVTLRPCSAHAAAISARKKAVEPKPSLP